MGDMETNTFRIRRAATGDEPILRWLRIEALTEAPDAFGSTLERELSRSQADWRQWLSPSATFILETATGPKGLAAGVPDRTDPAIVSLMAMWVDPVLRGSGAADLLVEAVLGWAKEAGALRIQLDVVQGNDRARHLYQRHQFQPTGQTAERARDGAIEVQMARPVDNRAGEPRTSDYHSSKGKQD